MHLLDSGLAATLTGVTAADWSTQRGRQTWGVEVKSAVTATPADGQGLRRLAEQCGAEYQRGVLLYAGDSAFALRGGRNLAMPLAGLWDM